MRGRAVEAVLLDLGHTVWDIKLSTDNWLMAWQAIHGRLKRLIGDRAPPAETLYREVWERILGRRLAYFQTRGYRELPPEALFAEAFGRLGLSLPRDFYRECLEVLARAELETTCPAQGVRTVLAELRRRGLKIGLVSNTMYPAELMAARLEELSLKDHFDVLAFSSAVGWRKPHPAIFQFALSRLGSRPERAVFVGDRIYEDVGGALKAGLRPVLSHQFRQEDPPPGVPVIRDLKELLELDALLAGRPCPGGVAAGELGPDVGRPQPTGGH
ncbi:MAG: hypothetical protein C4315_00265 [Chloroflexota bacterium]